VGRMSFARCATEPVSSSAARMVLASSREGTSRRGYSLRMTRATSRTKPWRPRFSQASPSMRRRRIAVPSFRGRSAQAQSRSTAGAASPAFGVPYSMEHPSPGTHVSLGQQTLMASNSFGPVASPNRQHSSSLGQQVLGKTCWLLSVHDCELGGHTQSQNEAKGSSKSQNGTQSPQAHVVPESQQIDPIGVSSPLWSNRSQHSSP
jgi:hypothetical protein